MSKTVQLKGDAGNLLDMLLGIISSTTTDPLYHISEIVQNEIDANATEINITFFRQGKKKDRIQKIIIDGNGFGFLESFEHYSENICESIKKYTAEYLERSRKGLSRGQFCIGLQGFRAVCEKMHVINRTKEDMHEKFRDSTKNDIHLEKMIRNRKMILESETLDVQILEENEFKDHKSSNGVTCILFNPKINIRSSSLIKYLSQNKRSELLANKKLKIFVIDGTSSKEVKPIKYSGKRLTFIQEHPKANMNVKYRGLGNVKATLYFHDPKPGSKIRLDVKGEPIHFDITDLPELDCPPWNSDIVEGIIEYDLLDKSPLRSGITRDRIFFPAFIDMMNELAKSKDIIKMVKDYEEKSKEKRDKKLIEKIENVMSEVKRELDFQTWFNTVDEKPKLGPLDHIKLFPEVSNVPVYTTRRVHVRAYDSEDNVLKEKNDITYEWNTSNELGTIIPKRNGEAIFKAGSAVGTLSINVIVNDLKTDKKVSKKIEIVITHPIRPSGKLARVRIEPMFSKIPLGSEKEYKAIAEDEDRNPIMKHVKFQWTIAIDETLNAELNIDYGDSVILKPGKNQGTIKLQVIAHHKERTAEDFAIVTVIEKKKRKKRKPKGLGLPVPDWYNDPYEFPLRHSYLSKDGNKININEGHPDWKNVTSLGEKYRQRYIANIYAKELVIKECEATGTADFGEKMLEVLSKIERFW